MPKMSLPKHAAAMCDAKSRGAGMQNVYSARIRCRRSAYEDVERMISEGRTDTEIALAHPDWADILPAVRSALRKKKKP